jgi:hypothetical protein
MSARWAAGRCSSGKTRFRNRGAVRQARDHTIQRTRRLYGYGPPPLFTYRCPTCRGWHLTSVPQAKPQKGGADESHG